MNEKLNVTNEMRKQYAKQNSFETFLPLLKTLQMKILSHMGFDIAWMCIYEISVSLHTGEPYSWQPVCNS